MTIFNQERDVFDLIEPLLCRLGLEKNDGITPLQGGNNQVYLLSGHKRYILKRYFKEEKERLKTEYSFLKLVWQYNIKKVPEPVLYNVEDNFAIYEYIKGRRLDKNKITKEQIKKSIRFLALINTNENKNSKRAVSLPYASEACQSKKDHIEIVVKRMGNLLHIDQDDAVSKTAEMFISSSLYPYWEKIRTHVLNQADIEKKLLKKEQIISPSDFGFHNAILRDNKDICFIDFEYAGWDDPVKMICDFFCQPEIPVPFKFFDYFIGETNKIIKPSYDLEKKVKLLLPLHRIKWCCIMLNVFLKIDKKRKDFACSNQGQREVQLKKTMDYASQHQIC